MAAPTKVNLKIYQGSTFKEVVRWEQATKVYKPITAIAKSAPVAITAVGHGMPSGWRFKVVGAQGMKEINSDDYFLLDSNSTTDTVIINNVNSSQYSTYTTGGVIEYNTPYNLTGITARMQIRSKVTDADIIDELTTENNGILIDNTGKTITIVISSTKTSAYTFTSAVYSLEIVNASAEVIPLIYGSISLEKEITR